MAPSYFLSKRRGGGGDGQGGGRTSSPSSISFSPSAPAPASKPAAPVSPPKAASPPKSASPPKAASPPKSASPPKGKTPTPNYYPPGLKPNTLGKDESGGKYPSKPKMPKTPKMPKAPKTPKMPKIPKPKHDKHGHSYNQGSGHRDVDSTKSLAGHGSTSHCGKKCGAGIGAAFGGIILIALILFIFLKWRNRRSNNRNMRDFSIVEAASNISTENAGERQEKDIELGIRESPAKVPSTPEQAHVKGEDRPSEKTI